MELITDDGIKLNYHDYGTGQPIVLVPGFGGYQEIWSLQVKYLLEMKNYRVITYDHRNHGASQRTQQNLTIDQLSDDLVTLVNHLKLDQPILVGHSMGASTCYAYLSKSKNVKSVMAIDQSPKMLNDLDWQYGFENINEENFKYQLQQPKKVRETLHGLDDRVFDPLSKAKMEHPFDRKYNLSLLFDHVQKDWRKVLINTEVPVKLVVARQSPYFDYHFGDILAEKNINITSVTMNNCGHDIMAEIPEEFNQTLRHFVFDSMKK
ncbi:alpha/beta hydrolase [Companilactobacillus alimentarius]|uniref:Alpha/beta hydrolase n=1 Tax=Companilactobacillus alimentarius DSM 20249 TaxID=1423720 RepID=A0A2K9HN41_9LACO|nr:alpha/beta hydrolase [Companilactobacillus alimentarius]AUI71553.1 alpha/beta hydrolase [Companilactobacillus alimentarius DSM 20249]KRK78446.1 alpha beta superfamily hydrolase [Companilactobacillus alimentarius DSM 20249]MDT6953467.1 alpha/beta hydrolase [Companilactobacillus alimentarius]GEO44721.1 alpha/beta hydrolase [Companilactobacillus alimentarius]